MTTATMVLTTSRPNTVVSARQRRPRKSSTTSQPKSPSTVWNSTNSTPPPSRATSADPSVHPYLQQHQVSPVALATANSNAGLNGWYMSMLAHKEGWSRLGFFGYDLQDQCGSTNSMSIRPDEGCIGELRGPNYPNYAMNVGHQGEYAAIAACRPLWTPGCLDPVPVDQDHISPTRRSSSISPNHAASSQRVQSASLCPQASAH